MTFRFSMRADEKTLALLDILCRVLRALNIPEAEMPPPGPEGWEDNDAPMVYAFAEDETEKGVSERVFIALTRKGVKVIVAKLMPWGWRWLEDPQPLITEDMVKKLIDTLKARFKG